MPDGVVLWLDLASGDVCVARNGREYAARVADVEPDARFGGARVHFDVVHDGGVEHAVDIRRRAGRRSDPHHRRVGSLAGAHGADTRSSAPFATPHPERGRALAGHPLTVVDTWAVAIANDDIATALALYAPDATVVDRGAPVTGRRARHAFVESLPMRGRPERARIRGEGDAGVVARWDAPDDERAFEVHNVVRHGQIVEQHVISVARDAATVTVPATGTDVRVDVLTKGTVTPEAAARARTRIAHVLDATSTAARWARVKLSTSPDPAVERPAHAEVTLDLDGPRLRAHTAATTVDEAIDLLEARVRDKLRHEKERRDARHHRPVGTPPEGEWRHGAAPPYPSSASRLRAEPQVVRRKSFTAEPLSVDEAVCELAQLDHRFHLYRDLATGSPALLDRTPDGALRLRLLEPGSIDPAAGATPPVALDDRPVPRLTLRDAIAHLALAGEDHVLFREPDGDEAAVLYRRYDGDVGVVTLDPA
jgi:ribosome-associated translation inhibitor RaiA